MSANLGTVGSGGRRAIPLRVPKPVSCLPPKVCAQCNGLDFDFPFIAPDVLRMNIMLKLTCALCVVALASCSGGTPVPGSGFPTQRVSEFFSNPPVWSGRPSMTATYRVTWVILPNQIPIDVRGRFSAVYDSSDQTIRLSGLSSSNQTLVFPDTRVGVSAEGIFNYNYRGGACTDRTNGCLVGGFTGSRQQGLSGFGEGYDARVSSEFVKFTFRGATSTTPPDAN